MNVSIEEISACRKRLKIEVPANRVNEALTKVTNDFQKEARIPGFRPGKAPLAMVQKKFQKDIEAQAHPRSRGLSRSSQGPQLARRQRAAH
jgi:trigger factor